MLIEFDLFTDEAVSLSVGDICGMRVPGFAIANPEAASADARPPAAVGLRLGDLLLLLLVGRGGGCSFAAEERRQGLRFLVPPTE